MTRIPRLSLSRLGLGLAFALVFSACLKTESASGSTAEDESSEATPSNESGARTYDSVGVVRGIDRERPSVTIQHEDVPGYMPAMTMPFDLSELSQVDGIEVGDDVAFTFRAEGGGRHVVVRITKR